MKSKVRFLRYVLYICCKFLGLVMDRLTYFGLGNLKEKWVIWLLVIWLYTHLGSNFFHFLGHFYPMELPRTEKPNSVNRSISIWDIEMLISDIRILLYRCILFFSLSKKIKINLEKESLCRGIEPRSPA